MWAGEWAGKGAQTSRAHSPQGQGQVATPGSTMAHQLKSPPAFFSLDKEGPQKRGEDRGKQWLKEERGRGEGGGEGE